MVRITKNIEAREYASGKSVIFITFQYRGARCREKLPKLDPSSKKDEKYAKQLLAEIERQISLNQFNYADYFPNSKNAEKYSGVSRKTVEQLLKGALADYKRVAKPSSYRKYEQPVNALWVPHLGHLTVPHVAPEHIREVIRDQDVTIKTMRNYLLPLRLMFDNAIDDGVITHSPLDRIKLARIMPKKKSGYEIDPYKLEEIDTLLAGFVKYESDWLNYFEYQFFTGCRPSETYALLWSKVGLVTRTVKIDCALVERVFQDSAKTDSGNREFALLDRALNAIQRQKSITYLAGEHVFINPNTKRGIVDTKESRRLWNKIHKLTGVRRRTQYQMRHTYASNLLSQGANPLKVAKDMGHKDVEMLFKVYGRWVDQGRDFDGKVSYGIAPSVPPKKLRSV